MSRRWREAELERENQLLRDALRRAGVPLPVGVDDRPNAGGGGAGGDGYPNTGGGGPSFVVTAGTYPTQHGRGGGGKGD